MQWKIRLTEGASVQAGSATRGIRTEMQFTQLKLAIEKTHTNFALKFQLTRFGSLGYSELIRLVFEWIAAVLADLWPKYQQRRGGVGGCLQGGVVTKSEAVFSMTSCFVEASL